MGWYPDLIRIIHLAAYAPRLAGSLEHFTEHANL